MFFSRLTVPLWALYSCRHHCNVWVNIRVFFYAVKEAAQAWVEYINRGQWHWKSASTVVLLNPFWLQISPSLTFQAVLSHFLCHPTSTWRIYFTQRLNRIDGIILSITSKNWELCGLEGCVIMHKPFLSYIIHFFTFTYAFFFLIFMLFCNLILQLRALKK